MRAARDRWSVILGSLALVAWCVTVAIALTGGYAFTVGPIRVAARDPYRGYYLGLVAACLALWRADACSDRGSWDRLPSAAPWIVAAASVFTAVCAIRYGAFVAGGSDAYGYVSQAILWNAGALSVAEPLAVRLPSLGSAVAPLGYRLAGDAVSIVPTYPPGLPLLMAAAMRMGGFTAAFLVVPVLGAATVLGTGALGTLAADRRTGVMAALLVACSPIFLLQAMQPMSDVPATAFWVVALTLALSGRGPWGGLATGLACSGAVLIRPNLVPLAAVTGLVVLVSRPRVMRLAAFGAGLAPGIAAVALTNRALYGSPLVSGYGANETLFRLAWIGDNLRRYPLWLLQWQTAFAFVGVAAPLLAAPVTEAGPEVSYRLRRIALLIFALAVLACYLTYIPFETWPFLRFLLPAIPLLLVLSSIVAVRLISLAAGCARGALFTAFCGLLCGHYLAHAQQSNLFRDGAGQQRYKVVAEYVDRMLPANAVIITVIHSGSLRLYGHRETLRWDFLDPDALDATVARLRANGYDPHVLLESWEESPFRSRFARSAFVRTNTAALAEYVGFEQVRIYGTTPDAVARSGAPVRIGP